MLPKIIAFIIVIVVLAYMTSSIWVSCNISYQMCTTLCDVKHITSDFKKAGCKGSCTSKKIACISKEAIQK